MITATDIKCSLPDCGGTIQAWAGIRTCDRCGVRYVPPAPDAAAEVGALRLENAELRGRLDVLAGPPSRAMLNRVCKHWGIDADSVLAAARRDADPPFDPADFDETGVELPESLRTPDRLIAKLNAEAAAAGRDAREGAKPTEEAPEGRP